MRLIDVNDFLERERSAEERQWRANFQPEVLKESYDWQTEYAILSHRWGLHDFEGWSFPTKQNMVGRSGSRVDGRYKS